VVRLKTFLLLLTFLLPAFVLANPIADRILVQRGYFKQERETISGKHIVYTKKTSANDPELVVVISDRWLRLAQKDSPGQTMGGYLPRYWVFSFNETNPVIVLSENAASSEQSFIVALDHEERHEKNYRLARDRLNIPLYGVDPTTDMSVRRAWKLIDEWTAMASSPLKELSSKGQREMRTLLKEALQLRRQILDADYLKLGVMIKDDAIFDLMNLQVKIKRVQEILSTANYDFDYPNIPPLSCDFMLRNLGNLKKLAQ